MNRIACVGSRETPPDVLDWMADMGAMIVERGFVLVSGNAPGADQAWARGGNSIDPSRVELCLPWEGFEGHAVHPRNVVRIIQSSDQRYYDDVKGTHPSFGRLSAAALKLHARNAMIVDGAFMTLAYLNHAKPGYGGTGGAWRIAQRRQGEISSVHDVSDLEVRGWVQDYLTRSGT